MTRTLVDSRRALTDLEEIFDYIAADNPRRARSYVDEIQQTCRSLCDAPLISTALPGLGIQVASAFFALSKKVA